MTKSIRDCFSKKQSMQSGFHNEIAYVQTGRVFPFLSPSKTLSCLGFSWKLIWPSPWSYDGQDLSSVHIKMHLFLNVDLLLHSQCSSKQLSFSYLSSSAKGLGRIAANYNSKSERNQELWCMKCISTHKSGHRAQESYNAKLTDLHRLQKAKSVF